MDRESILVLVVLHSNRYLRLKVSSTPLLCKRKPGCIRTCRRHLSSWTELKHDTILYAKQVMAEMGGGPEEEPPKGYVEPNPEAYARLLALVEMTQIRA